MSHLLISDANQHEINIFTLPELEEHSKCSLIGRTAVLSVTSNEKYAIAVHRDDNYISIIDPAQPQMVQAIAVDKQPTHFHAHDGYSVIFNDGSGAVNILNESDITQIITHPATKPDHGSALLIRDHLLIGYLRRGCVEVYHQGKLTQIFDCCPMLHGLAQIDDTAIFGCSDGVLLLKYADEKFTASKISNPDDTPVRVRVGLFATHAQQKVVAGNLGHGLALIDIASETMRVINLPDHPLAFRFDTTGECLFALTSDGLLHRLSLSTDELDSIQVTLSVAAPKGPDGKIRPGFTIHDNSIYIISPDECALLEVSADDLTVKNHLKLPFKPSKIVALKSYR